MEFTKYNLFLVTLLVVTGSINTICAQWADELKSVGSDGVMRKFKHPFVQACAMFIGELSCLLVFQGLYRYFSNKQDGSVDSNYFVKGNRNFNAWLLYLPATCDMISTSLMYIGMTLTYASSFQMLRGSAVVFTALLSVAFLNRKLCYREWTGIFLIIAGLVTVGISDFINSSPSEHTDTNGIITGDMLIIMAQVTVAVMFVLEEKFVGGLDIPSLQAVGFEGLFGFVTLSLLLIPFYFIPVKAPFGNNAHQVLEDLPDALTQIYNSPTILLAVLGTAVSIGFFNFAGISVTKEISATTRIVLDSVRTVVVWLFSLWVKWKYFYYLDLAGFTILVVGMCVYNNIGLSWLQRPSELNYDTLQDGSVINRTASRPE